MIASEAGRSEASRQRAERRGVGWTEERSDEGTRHIKAPHRSEPENRPVRPHPGYQAHASGAAPPLPSGGNSLSRRASACASSETLSAPSEASSCSMVRGPTMGQVTPGRESSQASATSAGSEPSSAQNFSYSSIF